MKKIVKFGAPWCGPCKMQDRILESLISAGYNVEKIDIDENSELADKYDVMNVPTIIIFEDNKEIHRFIGLTQKDKLIEVMN